MYDVLCVGFAVDVNGDARMPLKYYNIYHR